MNKERQTTFNNLHFYVSLNLLLERMEQRILSFKEGKARSIKRPLWQNWAVITIRLKKI